MFDDPDKFLKVAVGLGALLAGAGIGYHYAVFIPELERQKIEATERADEAERQQNKLAADGERKRIESAKANYESCLNQAKDDYRAYWNSMCKSFSQDGKMNDCTLPGYNADAANSSYESEKKKCVSVLEIEMKSN